MNNNIKDNRDRSMIDEQRPYAGLQFFREEDKEYFFGREREIKELAELIDQNILTIVFGKSGMGKTSLLRAGLLPGLRRELYIPVYLRINFNDPKHPPISQVKETVEARIKEIFPHIPAIEDKTLWEYFSYTDMSAGFVKPLLIFDQFEEVFQAQKENSAIVYTFLKEIADLIENRVPYEVQERLKKEQKPLSYAKKERDIRIIFSLREDYLPQLETLSKHIPSINGAGRFRVSYMKGEDAIDAVKKPAKGLIKDPDVAKEIIKKIPGPEGIYYKPFEIEDGSWRTKQIEPFLLSLFCYQVNERRIEKGANEISGELIGEVNTEDIINDFYNDNMRGFKPHVKVAIEDHLLTPLGYRKLEEKASLIERGKVTDSEILELVNKRLIRREEHRGVEYVELIHDVLAPILKASRDKRREIEKRRKEEERRKQEELRKKRKNRKIIITAVTVVFIVVAVLSLAALYQQKQAAEQKLRANEEAKQRKAYEWAAYSLDLLMKKDYEPSFRLAEAAYKIQNDNMVARKALLGVFYGGSFYETLFIKDIGEEFSQTTSSKSDFYAVFSHNKERILIVTVTSKKAVLWRWNGPYTVKDEELNLDNELTNIEFLPNAAFSTDDKYIVFCTKDEKKIVLWNLSNGNRQLLSLPTGVNAAAFSPGTNLGELKILTAGRDSNINFFDLVGNLIDSYHGHTGEVNAANFSPDGQAIVSASWDKTVRLWNLKGNQIENPFENHKVGVKTAEFSSDGKQVVSGSVNGSVILWDIQHNKSRNLGNHQGALTSTVFSPNGKYVLTAGEDRALHLLTVNNFLVIEFKDFDQIIHTASFSPDGKYILIALERGPAQIRLIDPEEIIQLVNQKGNVRGLTPNEKETYNLDD